MDILSSGNSVMSVAGEAGSIERITIAAYAIAALACWTAALSQGALRPDRRFWVVAGAIMAVFAIGKLLDLQTVLSQIVRSAAISEGVFSGRRQFQALFIALCAAAATLVALWLGWHQRHRPNTVRWAGLGLLWTTAFIVVRSVSYHDVDVLIGRMVWGVPVNSLLELAGISWIALAGFAYATAM